MLPLMAILAMLAALNVSAAAPVPPSRSSEPRFAPARIVAPATLPAMVMAWIGPAAAMVLVPGHGDRAEGDGAEGAGDVERAREVTRGGGEGVQGAAGTDVAQGDPMVSAGGFDAHRRSCAGAGEDQVDHFAVVVGGAEAATFERQGDLGAVGFEEDEFLVLAGDVSEGAYGA